MRVSHKAIYSEHDLGIVDGQSRKTYERPTVIYEANLEVRAGSPLSIPVIGPEDLFGTKSD
jgi:hypothetical protein